MKTATVTFLILFLSISSLFGQSEKPAPKHTFKVGYGTAFLTDASYFGKQRYLEYDRRLFRLMSLGLNGSHTAASQNMSDGFEKSTKALQAELTLFLSPINNEVNRLKLGAGAAYRHSKHRITDFTESPDGENISKDFVAETQDSRGFSLVLEYEIFIARHLVLGTRASFQQFEDAGRVYFWGLNAGVRF